MPPLYSFRAIGFDRADRPGSLGRGGCGPIGRSVGDCGEMSARTIVSMGVSGLTLVLLGTATIGIGTAFYLMMVGVFGLIVGLVLLGMALRSGAG